MRSQRGTIVFESYNKLSKCLFGVRLEISSYTTARVGEFYNSGRIELILSGFRDGLVKTSRAF